MAGVLPTTELWGNTLEQTGGMGSKFDTIFGSDPWSKFWNKFDHQFDPTKTPGPVKNCNDQPENPCVKAKKYYSQKGTAKLPNNANYGKFGWTRTKIVNGKSKPKWHGGVDVPGAVGDPVYAVISGKVSVTPSGPGGDLGDYVRILGDDGYNTDYAHLSKILVKNGQKVKCGDLIGEMGRTGNVPSYALTHVHIQRWKVFPSPQIGDPKYDPATDPTTLIF